jgi:hypothetical protein
MLTQEYKLLDWQILNCWDCKNSDHKIVGFDSDCCSRKAKNGTGYKPDISEPCKYKTVQNKS